jgi:hypothetical protein
VYAGTGYAYPLFHVAKDGVYVPASNGSSIVGTVRIRYNLVTSEFEMY